ncbi:MAG: putative N-formylglutamate amidohydrolase [Myxococcota bacterium]|jgi:predicted N-formylglutamate amidohydrolase
MADAYEFIPGRSARVFLTCEHASNRLPPPWTWSPGDERLVDDHWSWDLGAADLTRELAASLQAPAMLACFTRLLIDPNRPLTGANLFRDTADGHPVDLNLAISPDDSHARISGYWAPFHDAIDARVAAAPPELLLSIHSYTPVYEGIPRAVQVGVLHDGSEQLAIEWVEILGRLSGLDVRLDEPYTGRGGFMYSAQRHADTAGIPAVELEVRADLCGDPVWRRQLVGWIARALMETGG